MNISLNWLGKLLGTVRDLDVFIINVSGYKEQLEYFPEAKSRELVGLIVKQLRAPLKALHAALESAHYKSFANRLNGFVEKPAPNYPEAPLALKHVDEVAPQVITQKFENVVEQSKKRWRTRTFTSSIVSGFK